MLASHHPRIQAQAEPLAAALAVAAEASGRGAYPWSNTIQIEAAGGRLTLTGFDGETIARASIRASLDNTDALPPFHVTGRTMVDVIATLKGDLALELSESALVLKTQNQKSELRIQTSVPAVPAPSGTPRESAQLPAAGLAALSALAGFASSDSTRPVLTGVRIRSLGGDQLSAVAADGFRLGDLVVNLAGGTLPPDLDILVPASALRKASRRAGASPVSLSVIDGSALAIGFEDEGLGLEATIMPLLLSGNFPDVNPVIDPARLNPNAITLSGASLKPHFGAVKAVNSECIFLKFDAQEIGERLLVASRETEAGEHRGQVQIHSAQGAALVWLNVDLMRAFLELSGELVLKVGAASEPVLFEAQLGPERAIPFTGVLMPMSIRNEQSHPLDPFAAGSPAATLFDLPVAAPAFAGA